MFRTWASINTHSDSLWCLVGSKEVKSEEDMAKKE